jgi:hypothetical protein
VSNVAWIGYAGRSSWPEAACRGRTREMTMPGMENNGIRSWSKVTHQSHAHRIAAAKALCADCPVLEACRAWALTRPDPCHILIAGGMTPAERSWTAQQ